MISRFYFDHNATTPVSREVLDAYLPVLREAYGNASSIHQTGQQARQLLEEARRQIAAFLGCAPKQIVFLSGGTEADNLAVFGTVRGSDRRGKHVVASAIEHPAVLNACARLEREGVAVTYVQPNAQGAIEAGEVRRALRPETVLISVLHANNETGVLQPVSEIAAIGREAGVPVHVDGVQAVGRVPVNVVELGVDYYAISGHKLYAPKGVGALYVREGRDLQPLLAGGRHERGFRPGTENVPGAVALGAAAAWMQQHREEETARLAGLRDRLERGILRELPDISVNGGEAPRVPNTANLCFEGVEGESMVIALDLQGFAVSTGAACSSGAVEPSHVLLAMGLSRERARSSLRFSLGRANDCQQVDGLIAAVAASASRLRKLSPAYTPSR